MKKLMALALLLTILVGTSRPANAENQYVGKSLAELQEEMDKILLAMWQTDEWQKVEVPSGVYRIGEDIPAGKWSIGGEDSPMVTIATKLDSTGASYDWDSLVISEYIEKEYYPNGWTIILEDGQYIIIDGIAVFTPPIKGNTFKFK